MYVSQEVVEKYKMKAKVFEGMFKEQKEADGTALVFFAKIIGDDFQPVQNPIAMRYLESENHFNINLMGKLLNDYSENLSGLTAVEREYIYKLLDVKATENKKKYERSELPDVKTTEPLRALCVLPKVTNKEKIIEQYQMIKMIKKQYQNSMNEEQIRSVLLNQNFHQITGTKDDFEEGTAVYEAISHLEDHYGTGKYAIVLVTV